MSYDSDLQRVIRRATAQGFRVEKTSKGHWLFKAPDGEGTCSFAGTPSDYRSYNNSMADLRRIGYTEAEVEVRCMNDYDSKPTLGDVFPRPQQDTSTRPSARALIIDLLRGKEQNGMAASEIAMVVKSKRPDLSPNSVHQALSKLALDGRIIRMGHARYRLAVDHDRQVAADMAAGANAEEERVPPPPLPPQPSLVESPRASDAEARVDADLAEIDAALAALAKIEEVVRRNRALLVKAAQLRKLLNEM